MNRFSPVSPLKLTLALIALLVTCMPLVASAALPSYMAATGETQGVIVGSVELAGREGQMEVIEFGHSISQAIDSTTGIPVGDKLHRAIRLTKPIDKASPVLMTVMNTAEKLTSVVIRFWRPSSGGAEQQFYTVELVNAYIANISQSNRSFDPDDWTASLSVPANETLTISYEKIIWTWEDGSISSEDNWDQGAP